MFRVDVIDGRIVSVEGLPEDPCPSPIGQALVDGVQHDARVRRPAIRRGWLQGRERQRHLRGVDEFVDVPWDEALDLAAGELRRVVDAFGNTSIFAGSYGWASAGRFHHAQSQLHRFMNLLGGCTRALNTYSTAAAQVILPRVVAPWHIMELEQPTWDEIGQHTQLLVAFGGVPLRNTQVAYGGITEHQAPGGYAQALADGMRVVNISPLGSDAGGDARWLACRPGTDVALMLGLAYELHARGWVDQAFLESHTVGYERFLAYLLGASRDGIPKTPEWAEQICDIDATAIRTLAADMAGKRTLLAAAWSLQRADHGEQPYWMLVTLAAMLGQIGLPGGGFGFGYGAEGHIGSSWRRFHWSAVDKGANPTRFAIPVARIADMLLKPGETIGYDGREITYPDVRLVYWAGGNPFHHHQDLNRLVEAWRTPDTVIVNEPWWTPVAQWADIVFPATTALEREDLCASSHDPYAHVMEAALPPQHEARSDHAIFQGLARTLGFESEFTEGRSPREWLEKMWQASAETAKKEGFELPSFDEFWRHGQYRIPEAQPRSVWLSEFRQDPMKNPLRTPSGRIEIYSATIAAFEYQNCPGHPVWLEPFERVGGAMSDRYPLALLSPQPGHRLHSQLDHSGFSQAHKVRGKEVLTLHPRAAAERGVEEGMIVRVFNDRGACLAAAHLDDNMRDDVVVLPTGAWFARDPESGLELNGNPNVLTRDKGTSLLAQGPSPNTCMVEVEPYEPVDHTGDPSHARVAWRPSKAS